MLIRIIRFYQRTLSPDKGFLKFFVGSSVGCGMFPTCSEYTIQSIEKNGSIKGLFGGFRRILRCHPYQKNLIDLP